MPQDGKLAASEELGDLFKSASDWDTAQAIYQQAGASGKVVEALAAKGDFEQLVRRLGAMAVPGLCRPRDCSLRSRCSACCPPPLPSPSPTAAGTVHAVQRRGARLPLPAAGGDSGS